MRVLLVTDWNRLRGGAESYMATLRDGLRAVGDDVRLLTSSAGSAADGAAEYVAFGTEWTPAQIVLQIVNPFAVTRIRAAVREFRPAVAFVNMFAHHLSPAILPALGDVPIVLSLSDYKCICPVGSKLLPDGSRCTVDAGWVCHRTGCVGLLHWLRDQPRYALLRAGLRRVERVFACSRWLAAELARAGIAAEPLLLPIRALGPDAPRPPAAVPTFVFCGRLERDKGVDDLLGAFARVVAVVPEARLRVVGRGPERPRLEGLATSLALGDAITFTGWLEPAEIRRRLADAWALVAPSRWAEPLGLVAPEAMVCGVPVIATASGGFAETVEEGVSGLLVANGDVDALADRMLAVAQGRVFPTHRLAPDAVRRVAERHDVGRHVARLRETFAAVADGRDRR